MASSSLSQEDVDHEYEVQCSRRSRIRTARATRSSSTREVQDVADVTPLIVDFPAVGQQQQQEYDASPKPRVKDKRCPRPNHANKVKVQRERRKLREKRRSTGVMHLQSTESTGGSTGEEEEELLNMCAETRRNTALNETPPTDTPPLGAQRETEGGHKFLLRNNKSPSDLDADDEDNQDYDSAVNQSDSTMSLAQENALCELLGKVTAPTNGRPQTPCSEISVELLERAREENCRLLDLLKEKDVRIHTLEKKVITLGKELGELVSENRELRERNATLLGTLAKVAK